MASASTEYPMNIAMGSTAAASSSLPASVAAAVHVQQSSCAGPSDADWDTLSTNASESEPEVEEEEAAEISDGEDESTLPKSVAASRPQPPSLPLLLESAAPAVEEEEKEDEKPSSPTTSTATSISTTPTPSTLTQIPAQPKPQPQADVKKPRWADVLDTDSEDEEEVAGAAALATKVSDEQQQQQQLQFQQQAPAFEMPTQQQQMDPHTTSSSSSLQMGAVPLAEGTFCQEQWDLYAGQWAAQTQEQDPQVWMAQTGGDSWCGHGHDSASWNQGYCADYDGSWNAYRKGAKKGKRNVNAAGSAGWYQQTSWGNTNNSSTAAATNNTSSSHTATSNKGKSWKSSQKEQQWEDWTQTTGNASTDNTWPRGLHCNWGNGGNYGYGYEDTSASGNDAAAAGTGGYTGWSKPQCQFFIGIEEDAKFKVTRKILGPHGRHMKEIAQATNAKLRLRGRGSGFKEGQYNMESTDDLMLCVSAPDAGSYQEAVRMVTELLEDIYEQYRSFCHRSGESVAELAINLHEGPRPGSR